MDYYLRFQSCAALLTSDSAVPSGCCKSEPRFVAVLRVARNCRYSAVEKLPILLSPPSRAAVSGSCFGAAGQYKVNKLEIRVMRYSTQQNRPILSILHVDLFVCKLNATWMPRASSAREKKRKYANKGTAMNISDKIEKNLVNNWNKELVLVAKKSRETGSAVA